VLRFVTLCAFCPFAAFKQEMFSSGLNARFSDVMPRNHVPMHVSTMKAREARLHELANDILHKETKKRYQKNGKL